MEPPDSKMWTTIYPAYLDSKRTKDQGRKVPKALSVSNPTLQEISEVLSFFKLHHLLENKVYPRDVLERGRIKVKILDSASKPLNSEISNSNIYTETELLKKLAQFVPRLKSRMQTEEIKTEVKKKNKNKKKK
jgi:signal recognition particle subunit SRP19